MPHRALLPFLVTGEHENDMGMLKSVLSDFGPEPVFSERWSPTDLEFSPDRFAGLVILGDSYYRATSTKYDRERRWLKTALAHGRPVLAICYGAQLLASVKNGGRKPCGLVGLDPWHGGVVEVELRGAGTTDPVLAPLREEPLVTMSHEDCFQAPMGTDALAWSKCTEIEPHCEAFRVGEPDDAVYGLQFHPEPTEEMLERDGWFNELPEERRPTSPQITAAVATGEKVLRAWAVKAAAL